MGKDPKEYFLEFTPADSVWRVVSWNFDLTDPTERLWTLEVHREQIESIEWSRLGVNEVKFFRNKKLLRKRRVPEDRQEYRDLMNLCLHSTLKYSLESHHEFLLAPVSGATTADYQNEARSMQWLLATFGTVLRSLENFQGRSDLILTAAVFSGREPTTNKDVLRIMLFNLDIFCYFLEDFSLQIAVFDDKNLGHGTVQSPSFQQIIKVTKPQIYDEIVKLVHRVATVGEIS